MGLQPSPKRMLAILVSLLALTLTTRAVTLEELRHSSNLTPQTFAAFFGNFEFKFHDAVQSPEVFLASQSGDCDDYAILASKILSEKGYSTRLITVRMPKVVHVVCYVEETKSYLDYNNRACLIRTVSSAPDIQAVASKVARSYHAKWTSASEFTYDEGAKRLVKTVVSSKEDSIFASLFR